MSYPYGYGFRQAILFYNLVLISQGETPFANKNGRLIGPTSPRTLIDNTYIVCQRGVYCQIS